MRHLLVIVLSISYQIAFSQGIIEADTVQAAFKGDGSRLTNLPNQNLQVSPTGDTLFITEGNFVIIPGISSSNSGNAFANAGPDIVNACETSFNLQASPLSPGTTGEWSIISGTGGVIINKMLPQALFAGQEGESYTLQWTVQLGGGSSAFDQVNISIAFNTQTSVADAGNDLFAIMNQSVVLNGNVPEVESAARWEIVEGTGGILSDINDPAATFTGVPGESYTLRWYHYNDCSTSTDEVTLTFSESAAGVPSANGRYFIPDPKFRQYLQIAYPSVMDGDSLIVAVGDQVDKIRITNLNVVNLDGIQYLNKYEVFEAFNNYQLQSIPSFSDSLRVFRCECGLTVIPPFPRILDTLEGWGWHMSDLPPFPDGLQFLVLNNIEIKRLSGFPSSLNYLRLSGLTNLDSLPKIPDGCSRVYLRSISGGYYYNTETQEIIEITFEGAVNIPDLASEFSIEHIPGLDSFPELPNILTNLKQLEIRDTDISLMPSLYNMTSLKTIYLDDNQLLVIDSLPFATQNLSLYGNPIICVKNKPPLVETQMSEYEICPE